MSKFLPAVVVADSLRELDVPTDKFMSDFDKIMELGVKRMSNFQNKDGGWGWFSEGSSQTFMSAYVVYGLIRAQNTGVKVDPVTIDGFAAALER